jgi:hypothetical protein
MMENINPKQFYSTVAIAMIVFVFCLTFVIVLSMPLPLGSDPYFHMEIARLYGTGNFTGAFNYIQSVNQIPFYPPLYHIALIPIAISPDPYTGLRILEMFAMPLTFFFTAWLLWKQSGPKAALIGGLILIGSWSFIDASLQARPETIDLMLYPLMLMALLSAKKKPFALLAIATVYNHGIMALTNIWGFVGKLIRKRTWLKTLVLTTLAMLPILLLTLYYFTGGWSMWATTSPTENPQEVLFWTNPSWIPFYAGLTLIGFFFIFNKPIIHDKEHKHLILSITALTKSKTELEAYLKWGLLGNLVMLPLWADRWLQYSTIPLACLVGIEIARWHGKKLYVALAVIALGAWLYTSFFLFNSFYHNWWQPGYFIPQGGT